MRRRLGPVWLSVLLLTTLAGVQNLYAQQTEQAPVMQPLAKLEAGLRAHPPRPGWLGNREALIAGLEAWIDRDDTVYWNANPQASNPDLFAYYLQAIQRALHEAESIEVESGAMVWKLYSSGFLVKTPETVFAIDAVEGPYKSISRSPEEEEGYLFHWTPEMRRRFGNLVQTLFITHRHYDHASYALANEVGAAGHTIVAPAEFQTRYWSKEPFAPQLRTLAPDTETRLGPLIVRSFQAVQAMQKNDAAEYAILPTDPQNNVYLIRTVGLTFLHNGDNRGKDFTPWLKQAVADGWRPDVWFKILAWPRTLVNDVNRIASPVIVPGHEWEMGHKPKYGTSKLIPFYKSYAPKLAPQKRLLVMTWGERYHFAGRK